MNCSHYEKTRNFKPLIIFHNQDISPANNTVISYLDEKEKLVNIEKHRLKTECMLKQNAKLWENEGSSRRIFISSDELEPETPLQQNYKILAVETSKKTISLNTIRLYKEESNTIINSALEPIQVMPSKSPSNKKTEEGLAEENGIIVQDVKQTENPPEYSFINNTNESLPKNSSVKNTTKNPLSAPESRCMPTRSSKIAGKKKKANNSEESVIETRFIVEPYFHHVYKSHINKKRRRGNLPKKVTDFLKQWLFLHKNHPYPTEKEKQKLADQTGLMVSQISNWFINARRRILQPLIDSEIQESFPPNQTGEQANISYNSDAVANDQDVIQTSAYSSSKTEQRPNITNESHSDSSNCTNYQHFMITSDNIDTSHYFN